MSTAETQPAVNRKLLILLGVVAALALVAVFVVPLLSGGDAAVELATTPAPAADGSDVADADAPDDEDAAGDAADEVPETFEVFNARDPFQQLVEPEVAEAAPADEGVGTGDGDPDSGADADGDPADGEPIEEPTPAAEVGATTVALEDVVADTKGNPAALVTVNGAGYNVAPGERFAQRFELLEIDGQCAVFLFGDNRFALCKGDEIRK